MEPRFAPFDWTSLFLLVTSARAQPMNELHFAKNRIGGSGEGPFTREQVEQIALLEDTIARLHALEADLTSRSETSAFPPSEVKRVVTELRTLPVLGRPGDRGDAKTLSTKSIAKRDDWHGAYVDQLHRHCLALHATGEADIPHRIWEEMDPAFAWKTTHEFGLSGNYVLGYVHAFEPDEDIVLLQLPTSDLMRWQWGDVHSVAITIKRGALAMGDFSDVRVQVTN